MDKPTKRQIGGGVGRLWIGGSMLVALDQSSWVNRNGSRCLWIDVGAGDRCLWVNGNGFLCLWIGAFGLTETSLCMCICRCGSALVAEMDA